MAGLERGIYRCGNRSLYLLSYTPKRPFADDRTGDDLVGGTKGAVGLVTKLNGDNECIPDVFLTIS